MSANVQPTPLSEVGQTSGPSPLTLEDSKGEVIAFLKKRLNRVKLHYHEFLAELTYLQGGGLLTEFESWRRDRPQDLMHALFSGHLGSDDIDEISAFMSGHLPMHEMFPIHVDSSQADDMDDDSDEDFDVCCPPTDISTSANLFVRSPNGVIFL